MEALNTPILHRTSGLEVNQFDLAFFRPTQHPARAKFRSVLGAHAFRPAALLVQPIESPRHATAVQARIIFQRQALASKCIDRLGCGSCGPFASPSTMRSIAHSWLDGSDGARSAVRGPAVCTAGAQPTLVRHPTDRLASHSPLVLDALAPHAVFDIHSAASAWPASPALHATPRFDPDSSRTDSWLDPRRAACRPRIRSDGIQPIRTQCLLSDRQAPALFSDDSFHFILVQTHIGNQRL